MPDIVLVRHGESSYNQQNLLNGDPTVDVGLSAEGRRQCQALSMTLDRMTWGSLWTTRFPRTKESMHLLVPTTIADWGLVPHEVADLDDIGVGIFEGRPIDEMRAWRREHATDQTPPHGEAVEDVVHRYARGLLWLLEEAPRPALVVTHDQPIRYVMNALAGDHPLRGTLRKVPNAVPYPFSEAALSLAAKRLHQHVAG